MKNILFFILLLINISSPFLVMSCFDSNSPGTVLTGNLGSPWFNVTMAENYEAIEVKNKAPFVKPEHHGNKKEMARDISVFVTSGARYGSVLIVSVAAAINTVFLFFLMWKSREKKASGNKP